ncbi:AMED_5909 family protein [Saccharomonospora saliphila]|uniref:AMED_5909 family protein n=1 Tax=Saccharomonospora saliphila TaxID=369829 RepID=UPI001E64E861|nr:AMED_5909 family protein [Saccharomonospora saliphila]
MAEDVGPVPQVRTLMQAHEALVAERPELNAPAKTWRRYYLRSARVYAEVAEIDRGHHHEALYWADRERRKAEELEAPAQ